MIQEFHPLTIWDSINKPREKCKLICEDFPKVKLGYDNGKKFCPRCQRFLFTEKIHCVCCGCQLRSRPYDKNLKEKRKRKAIEDQRDSIEGILPISH